MQSSEVAYDQRFGGYRLGLTCMQNFVQERRMKLCKRASKQGVTVVIDSADRIGRRMWYALQSHAVQCTAVQCSAHRPTNCNLCKALELSPDVLASSFGLLLHNSHSVQKLVKLHLHVWISKQPEIIPLPDFSARLSRMPHDCQYLGRAVCSVL